jgi:hypothetical protein
MLADPRIREVWSEAHDDVVLIWQAGPEEEVEFVQVKGAKLNQLWSVALLCEQSSDLQAKHGTSIIERSLCRHCCSEACRFRIVTAEGVQEELRPLTYETGSNERIQEQQALVALSTKLAARTENACSPNGQGTAFWVSHTVWQVVHTTDALKTRNLRDLDKQLEQLGHFLLADQR